MSLQDYLDEGIKPMYADLESKGHGFNTHVQIVVQESLLLAFAHPEVNILMVLAIAYYHDLGLLKGREDHEIRSAKILRNDFNLNNWFSEEEIEIMAQAVEDHRSGKDIVPRSIYGMIISEADRDLRPHVFLERYVQAKLEEFTSMYGDLSRAAMSAVVFNEANIKYGENGKVVLHLNSKRNLDNLALIKEMLSDRKCFDELFDRVYDDCVKTMEVKKQ